jgi:hypothetical protein
VPAKKTYEKEKPPMAALVLLLLLDAGLLHIELNEKMAAPLAAQEPGKKLPTAVEAGAPCRCMP